MATSRMSSSKRDEKRHLRAMQISAAILKSYWEMHRPGCVKVRPQAIIRLLNGVGVGYVVIGTHGLNGYRDEPRATQDVDVLVRQRDQRKAAIAVQGKYPKLIREEAPEAIRFVDPTTDLVAVDLWRPFNPLLRLTFRNAISVNGTMRVPTLEMALVARFAVMISSNRELSKQYLDAGDFLNVYLHNRDEVDELKLRKLADAVSVHGGERIMKCLADGTSGRVFAFWKTNPN